MKAHSLDHERYGMRDTTEHNSPIDFWCEFPAATTHPLDGNLVEIERGLERVGDWSGKGSRFWGVCGEGWNGERRSERRHETARLTGTRYQLSIT